jgi:vacuolar protein sorting-associated protein 33A
MSSTATVHQSSNMSDATTGNTIISSSGGEAEIILPPPSARNPIPSLSAALRVDNYEQVVQLLSSQRPIDVSNTNAATVTSSVTINSITTTSSNTSNRQFLMFGSESLRTLILRQVLTDPQHSKQTTTSTTTTSNSAKPNQSSNSMTSYTIFPNLPRHLNIIGTAILEKSSTGGIGGSNITGAPTTTTSIIPPNTDIITYFIRPTDLWQTQVLCEFILKYQSSHRHPTQPQQQQPSSTILTHHRIVYIPQIPLMVQKILSNVGLIGPNNHNSTSTHPVTIHSLSLDLFPVEPDVLSMEFPDTFRELHVEGTPSTMITYIARSLLKLQDIVGTIPRVQSYGVASEQIVRKMFDITVDEYCAQPSSSSTTTSSSSADELHFPSETVVAMILFDRKIDLVTPLVTPLTYEGLLDDVVGIENGFINVNVDIVNPPEVGIEEHKQNASVTEERPKMVTLAMNESDTMFSEIRDQHVEQFGTYLQQQAKSMQATQNDFKATGKQKELSELHQFVKQLPHMKQKFQFLATHIHLAELIKYTSEQAVFRERWQMERTILEGDTCYDELDDLVAMSYPMYRFLRLLCLQSICKNGINSSRYDSLRKDFVQTYGYEFVALLVNLEKAGLLRRKEAFLGMDKASAFSKVKDLLVLINAEVDTIDPDDISYVSSGYAPLTVRLLQSAVTGWKNGRDDILREIPGRFIDVHVQGSQPPDDLATMMQRPVIAGGTYGSLAPNTNTSNASSTTMSRTTSRIKPVLVVVYIGGVSYMEITALRFLSKRPNFPYHIIICTTNILNGNTFLKSLV